VLSLFNISCSLGVQTYLSAPVFSPSSSCEGEVVTAWMGLVRGFPPYGIAVTPSAASFPHNPEINFPLLLSLV